MWNPITGSKYSGKSFIVNYSNFIARIGKNVLGFNWVLIAFYFKNKFSGILL